MPNTSKAGISLRFGCVYLLSLLCMGVTYLSITPVFEGFDENAHFSSVRQIADTGTIPFYGQSFLDQFVVGFQGPVHYDTDTPPFDQGMVYKKFFASPELVEQYRYLYRQPQSASDYQPSQAPNWQAQHPPLYYLLVAPFLPMTDYFSFTTQIFVLRLLSFLLALSGVAFGLLAVRALKSTATGSSSRVGFLCYPLVLPMFFPEFTRIGNDALCLLWIGLITYLFSLWVNDEHNVKKLIAIGVVLGLGLLTKALFLPVILAVIFFLLIRVWKKQSIRVNQVGNLMQVLIPALLIGGGWYLYQWVSLGQFSGSGEAIMLEQQGGMFAGLKENFSLTVFLRALLVPFVTYSWAGTWSMARLPAYFHLPLLGLACWIFMTSLWQLRRYSVSDIKWLPVWLFIFFNIGFLWHILVNMALYGRGGTPGWYLHILMPMVAPVIGLGVMAILNHAGTKRLLVILLAYAVMYHLVTLWSQFALFTGCASKGLDKYYIYSGDFFCLDQAPLLIERLSVFGYPTLAILGIVGWGITTVWLVKQVCNKI